MLTESKISYFIQGAITPQLIAGSIAIQNENINCGAHEIFLGQVRADVVEGKTISSIEYSAYQEMAEQEMELILKKVARKHQLIQAKALHSIGKVNAGEICLFVFVSSQHRQNAFDACHELVELIKKNIPVFGKEILEDESYRWKENTDKT